MGCDVQTGRTIVKVFASSNDWQFGLDFGPGQCLRVQAGSFVTKKSTYGPKYAASLDSAESGWANAGNITGPDDGQVATWTFSGPMVGSDAWIEVAPASLGLAAGEQVTGIEIAVKLSSGQAYDLSLTTVQLRKGGVLHDPAAVLAGALTSSLQWYAAGGASDLFGASWQASDFNGGVTIRLTLGWEDLFPGSVSPWSFAVNVDAIRLTVHTSRAALPEGTYADGLSGDPYDPSQVLGQSAFAVLGSSWVVTNLPPYSLGLAIVPKGTSPSLVIAGLRPNRDTTFSAQQVAQAAGVAGPYSAFLIFNDGLGLRALDAGNFDVTLTSLGPQGAFLTMADRFQLNQRCQFVKETTKGQLLAATNLLKHTSLVPTMKANFERHRSEGIKRADLSMVTKEWSEAKLSGIFTYTETGYFFDSLIGNRYDVTRSDLGTGVYDHVWISDRTLQDTLSSFTFEVGDVNAMERFGFGMVKSLAMKGNRDKIDLSGDVYGQKMQDSVNSIITQTIAITGSPTGGTYVLSYNGSFTTALAYNANAAAIQAALVALPTIGTGNVTVTGSSPTFTVTGAAALAGQDMLLIGTDGGANLTGGSTPAVTAARATGPTLTVVNEVQTVTVNGTPTGGTFQLSYNGQTTGTIAYNAAASVVQTALQGLATVGSGNLLVTGGAGGPYTCTFAGSKGGMKIVNLIVGDAGASLTGGSTPSVSVARTTPGGLAETAKIPVVPDDIDVYLATTSGALGTLGAQLVRSFDSQFAIADRTAPFYVQKAANQSFEGYAEIEAKETMTLLLQADSTAMALRQNAKNGQNLYIRIQAVSKGYRIGTTSIPYLFQLDASVRVSAYKEFKHEQGIYAIEFDFEIQDDPAFGQSYKVLLRNGIASY